MSGTSKSLFSFIYEMLKMHEGYKDEPETIQIAKGKYELPLTLRDAVAKMKRQWLK